MLCIGILYPELLFPFLVLDAVDASSGTSLNEIARLGEENKKLVLLVCSKKRTNHKGKTKKKCVGKLEKSHKKLEDSQKKHWQHLGDLETKSNTMENDVKKVRFHRPNDIL